MNLQTITLLGIIVFIVVIVRIYILFVNSSKNEDVAESTIDDVIARARQLMKNNMHNELQRYIKKELQARQKNSTLRTMLADSYFDTGNFTGAAKHYEAVLHFEPKDYNAKLKMANALKLSNHNKKAMIAYEDILRTNPKEPAALLNMSEISMVNGLNQAALEYLQRYIALERNSDEIPKIYSRIAKLNLELGNYSEAVRVYDKLQNDNPDSLELMLIRANIYLKLEDWQKCLDIYNHYLKFKPDDHGIHEKIGQMKFNLGLWDEALEFYNEIVIDEDTTSQSYIHHRNRIAEIYINQGKNLEAIAILTDLIKKYPTEDLLAFTLAQAYIALGDFEKAVTLYTNLMENIPNDQLATVRKHISGLIGAWGDSLLAIGNYSEAFNKFMLALQYDEHNPDIYYKLGMANYSAKSYNDAIANLKRAIALTPQESNYYLMLGHIFEDLGDTRNSQSSFKDAININPLNVKAHNALAMSYAKEHNYLVALKQFERVLEFNPDDPDVNYNYALTHELNGDKDNAIKYYRKTLKEMPNHLEAMHNLKLLLGDESEIEPEI